MQGISEFGFDRGRQAGIERAVAAYCDGHVGHGDQVRCSRIGSCKGAAEEGRHFTGPMQPYIGARYALRRNGVPFRLLVYSMDAGAADAYDMKSRAAEIATCWPAAFDDGSMRHPAGTLLSVQAALGLPAGGRLASVTVDQEQVSALDCFALANFTLCARPGATRKNSSHVTATMRTNCRDHVAPLLRALAPTHVIVQGRVPQSALDKTVLSGVYASDGDHIWLQDGVRYAYLPHPSGRHRRTYWSVISPWWPDAASIIRELVTVGAQGTAE